MTDVEDHSESLLVRVRDDAVLLSPSNARALVEFLVHWWWPGAATDEVYARWLKYAEQALDVLVSACWEHRCSDAVGGCTAMSASSRTLAKNQLRKLCVAIRAHRSGRNDE